MTTEGQATQTRSKEQVVEDVAPLTSPLQIMDKVGVPSSISLERKQVNYTSHLCLKFSQPRGGWCMDSLAACLYDKCQKLLKSYSSAGLVLCTCRDDAMTG